MGVDGGERAARSDWARRLNLSPSQSAALGRIATKEDRSVAYIIRRAVLDEINRAKTVGRTS